MTASEQPASAAPEPRLPCAEIRALLFAYMTRELGAARSELVRVHVRKCAACRAAAAEMQAALDCLRAASPPPQAARLQLSDARRRRVRRACMHPLLARIERHHVLVSILLAALVVAAVFLAVRYRRAWNYRVPRGIPVRVLPGPPADAEGARHE
jgi:anti-sigma factor RsiW